jgi:histidine triad (HIT) family protein
MSDIRCAYCEIPAIKEREIIRNEHAWAFPTNIPIVPGHVLIAPLRCAATIEDLTAEELAAIFELRTKLKTALTAAFGAEGFNCAWNEGKLAGQSVPHFHLHILPRKAGDTGITEYEPRKFLYRPGEREASPEAELQGIAAVLKKALA